MQPWKTLSRQIRLVQSSFLTVESHTVELPDGRIIPDWPWVIKPDFVNVVAVTAEGKFLCFRQTKYGIEGTSLAPVGGHIEAREDPLDAAKRELLEETGYEAPEWIHLGSYRVDANSGVATGHLFLACKARCSSAIIHSDLEEQELLYLDQHEMETALANGEFKVFAWTAIVALALHYLDKKKKQFG